MVDWTTIILSSIGGIMVTIGTLIGIFIAPKLNHKYSVKKLELEYYHNLEYKKKEILFEERKKIHKILLQYLEEESDLFKNLVSIKDKKERAKIISQKESNVKEFSNEMFMFCSSKVINKLMEFINIKLERTGIVGDYTKISNDSNLLKIAETARNTYGDIAKIFREELGLLSTSKNKRKKLENINIKEKKKYPFLKKEKN